MIRVSASGSPGSNGGRCCSSTLFKPVVDELSAAGVLPTSIVESAADPKTYTARFHDLRHSWVAMLIARWAQQHEVTEHLGHTNIQTTINTYGHLFPSVRVRIRTALEKAWATAHGESRALRSRASSSRVD
jgi:integrase